MSSFHVPAGRGPWQIRGRRVRDADTERAFVAAAPAAKTIGIEQAEVQRSVIFLTGVAERNLQPLDTGRHLKRYEHVAVRLTVIDSAVQVNILSFQRAERDTKHQTEKHNVQTMP